MADGRAVVRARDPGTARPADDRREALCDSCAIEGEGGTLDAGALMGPAAQASERRRAGLTFSAREGNAQNAAACGLRGS